MNKQIINDDLLIKSLWLLIFAIGLGCNDKPVITSPGQNDLNNQAQFSFSKDRLINQKYYTENTWDYLDILYNAYWNIAISGTSSVSGGNIIIDVPDTMYDDLCSIKLNYYAAEIESSRILSYNKIDDYSSRTYDACGTFVYFDLSDNPHVKRNCLYIISEDSIDLALIDDDFAIEKTGDADLDSIKNYLMNFFNVNDSIYHSQIYGDELYDDTEYSVDAGMSLYSISSSDIDLNNDGNNECLINGISNHCKFTAILFKDSGDIWIDSHSSLDQLIKIEGTFYLLLNGYVPGTGINGCSLYRINNKNVERIFSDYSYSA